MKSDEDPGIIPFEEPPQPPRHSGPEPEPPSLGAGSPTRKPCPSCGVMQPGATERCMTCGHSFVSPSDEEPPQPAQPTAPKRKPVICPSCGYDATGIIGDTCPECGVNLLRAAASRERQARASRQYRAAIVVSLSALGGALIATVVVVGLMLGWDLVPFYLAFFGIKVAIAVGVFFGCSLAWIGFDAPMPIVAMRIAGIYAVLDIVQLLLGQISVVGGLYAALVTGAIYIRLLMKALDLEMFDALLVVVITRVVNFVIAITIIQMLT